MPYETIEEAIDIANGTRYGLGASVFGPDQDECLKVAKQLDCGMVSVNDFAVFYVSWCIKVVEVIQLMESLGQVSHERHLKSENFTD